MDRAVRVAGASREAREDKAVGVSKEVREVKAAGEARVDKEDKVAGANREVREDKADGNDVNPLNISHQNINKSKTIKIHSTCLKINFQSISQQSIRFIAGWNLPVQNCFF